MDDDEEVLLTLAEILPSQLEFAGGPQYAEHVLRPLEKLCASEETTVRDKVSSLPPISSAHQGGCYGREAIFLAGCSYCLCFTTGD